MSYGQPPAMPPQQPWGALPPKPPAGPRPGWARKRIVIPAAAVLFFVGVGIGSAGGDSAATDASAKPTATVTETAAALAADEAEPAPTVTATKTVTAKPKPPAEPKVATFPGDGTFVVGDDIKAGTYKTVGPEDEYGCYWARLKGTSGDFEDIIANGNVTGQTTVTIASSDGAFETTGCKEWKKVG